MLTKMCFLMTIMMLQRVAKEKNAIAERLKSAEAARKRGEEELKRYATENATREEIRQSLEDEVRRLKQTVGQTEGEKQEKEELIARCETYIAGLESKLQDYQVFASYSLFLFHPPGMINFLLFYIHVGSLAKIK